jgi:hypothetical protein
VSFALSLPDEIVLINPPLQASGGARLVYVSNGWSTINGTYNFELNLSTCKWNSSFNPDASGIFAEAWNIFGGVDCSDYLVKIEDESEVGIPVHSPKYYRENDVLIDMITELSDSVLAHAFGISVNENGPFLRISFEPSTGNEDRCGESPLIVDSITLASSTPDLDCENLGATTGTAESHED